jgi:CRISPR-associated protein Csx10
VAAQGFNALERGYGQIRFNHPLLMKMPTEWPTSTQVTESGSSREDTTSIPANDPAFAFARLLERECWKQEIRRACLAIASDRDRRQQLLGWRAVGDLGEPPMSQLGGLRGQLALLRVTADRLRVIDWLDHLAANSRRKDKWPSISKVKAIIEEDPRIWEIIISTSWPTLTQGAEAQLRRELWPLAVRTFFDACIRAHKRELEVPSGA